MSPNPTPRLTLPDRERLIALLREGFALDWRGDHGIAHWGRVRRHGLELAAETGADPHVVELFALLHDSQRLNEGHDPEHGARAAWYAAELRGEWFEVSDRQFAQLTFACTHHTHVEDDPDMTIATCWDADRLDLYRVGIVPDPARLCTAAARDPERIAAAIRLADGG